VVGIFMNQLLRDEPMTVFGDGTQQRAFTHINDVAPIIAASVDFPAARNQLFNVGADVPYTVNELAEVVSHAMAKPCNLNYLDARNEVKIAFSDHSKAERIFGIRDKMALPDGVSAMANWVREHGARESSIFEGIEVPRKMPESWAKVALVKA
jgi:UDP-glucose 4-epimerase